MCFTKKEPFNNKTCQSFYLNEVQETQFTLYQNLILMFLMF